MLKLEIDEHMPNHTQIDRFKSLVASPPKDQRPVACTITPNLANHILADETMVNVDQRKRNKRKVDQYAESMRNGNWSLTGDTIKMSHKLEDGQHRLKACVDAKTSFKTFIMFGLDEEIFYRLDQGKVRDRGDIFHMDKIKYPTVVSAATRWVRILNEGTGRGAYYIPEELLEYYRNNLKNEAFEFFVKLAVAARKVSKIPPAPLIAMCYLEHTKGVSKNKLIQFINDTGNLTAKQTSAGVIARDALNDLKSSRNGRLHENIRTGVLNKCLNAHVSGKKITRSQLIADYP